MRSAAVALQGADRKIIRIAYTERGHWENFNGSDGSIPGDERLLQVRLIVQTYAGSVGSSNPEFFGDEEESIEVETGRSSPVVFE